MFKTVINGVEVTGYTDMELYLKRELEALKAEMAEALKAIDEAAEFVAKYPYPIQTQEQQDLRQKALLVYRALSYASHSLAKHDKQGVK